jgi:5-methyltetrahydrofolate--homocysteine methyltransferase
MTNRKYTNRRYLDALEKKVLVFDGAMGTSLQVQNLTAEHFGGEQYNGCNDYLVISYPAAVEKVHRSFLEVGVDVLETDTFRSNRITMAEYKLGDRVIEINETAASLARHLADEYAEKTGQPRFVAGSIGPSGKLPSTNDPELSNVSFDELSETFREQAVGLIRGGVDLLLIETSQDILEVKAAIIGIHKAFDETQVWLPIQAQVTLDTTGRMLLGTDINASLAILEGMGIDVIGLNCSTGPEHMRQPIQILGEKSTLPVSCIPNAGLPLNVDGQAVYPLEPEPFAKDMYEFVTKHNISIVGGCCGTTPQHLKLLVDKLNQHPHPKRPTQSTPQLASAMSALDMRQDPPPTLLGERLNAQGSRKFKRLLLEEDYDSILEIAREQVDFGAHALDISCAVTERPDEVELMRKVVKKLEMGVDVPLVIDTTELDVLEVALKTVPGRCLINSTHLESGRDKADKIFKLAKDHNAAVIVLTIDENGMAKTREKKLEVAKRIYDIAVNDHGLKPEDLVYDTLTFTLATGDEEFANSAIETIEGIRLIKQELPGVMASLGVSNLSFGFAPQARPPLNSVMLYHCIQAGLDMAIVNPAHITAYADIPAEEKELCEDLIFNRRKDALQRYIEHYEKVAPTTESTLADPTAGMTPEQRLHWKIVHRHKEGVEADIDEVINRGDFPTKHETAVHTLNNVLLPAMKEVGDKFGAGELILPFVLQSAEAMKKTVAHLENYLEKMEGVTKGTVVIATVYGDVHDIGKNLVKTISRQQWLHCH